MKWEHRERNCSLSSIAVMAVFFYATAAPLQKKAAHNPTLNMAIENFEKYPLQIVSATVTDISVPTQRTQDVTAHLLNPKIVLKNNSDHAVSIYVLEFRKAGLEPFYLTRTDIGLGPKGTDSIETNSPKTFLHSAGEAKATGTGDMWTVRIAAVRFKDGKWLRCTAGRHLLLVNRCVVDSFWKESWSSGSSQFIPKRQKGQVSKDR